VGGDLAGGGVGDPWARPLWTPSGGDAMVWFGVFGADADLLEISTDEHRVEEVPEGVDAHELGDDWVRSLFDAPIGEVLLEREPELATLAAGSDSCIVVTGTVEDPPRLDYLRDTVGIATAALDTGGVAVLSLQTLELFDPDRWRTDVFDGGADLPRRLVTLLSSDEEDGADDERRWIHTRGMRAFGRPDVSVRGVAPNDLDAVSALVDALVLQQARGLVVEDGSTMDVGELGTLRFHLAGHLDDPDFNNEHLDVRWT
jgi:hypothetical protein